MKSHINWLIPIGARLCSLKVQLNSVLHLCWMLQTGVNHSSTENYIFLWLCPSFLTWRDAGVCCPSFWTDALCSYILFLSALLVFTFLFKSQISNLGEWKRAYVVMILIDVQSPLSANLK